MSDDEYVPAATGTVLAEHADGAHAGTAFAPADGDRAAIVTNNDLVSEVGW